MCLLHVHLHVIDVRLIGISHSGLTIWVFVVYYHPAPHSFS